MDEKRTLLFVDESAFYPLPGVVRTLPGVVRTLPGVVRTLPGVVRTWAPRGQTPLLRHTLTRHTLTRHTLTRHTLTRHTLTRHTLTRHTLTRDHLSVISAITPEGELFLQMQECPLDSLGIITFLEELQRQIAGKLLIILLILWDGATIHRSRMIKQYLADGAAARLPLERLPGYAPGLNPDEGVWHYLKHKELGNVCCRDLCICVKS